MRVSKLLVSVNLGFLICKMGMIIAPMSLGYVDSMNNTRSEEIRCVQSGKLVNIYYGNSNTTIYFIE